MIKGYLMDKVSLTPHPIEISGDDSLYGFSKIKQKGTSSPLFYTYYNDTHGRFDVCAGLSGNDKVISSYKLKPPIVTLQNQESIDIWGSNKFVFESSSVIKIFDILVDGLNVYYLYLGRDNFYGSNADGIVYKVLNVATIVLTKLHYNPNKRTLSGSDVIITSYDEVVDYDKDPVYKYDNEYFSDASFSCDLIENGKTILIKDDKESIIKKIDINESSPSLNGFQKIAMTSDGLYVADSYGALKGRGDIERFKLISGEFFNKGNTKFAEIAGFESIAEITTSPESILIKDGNGNYYYSAGNRDTTGTFDFKFLTPVYNVVISPEETSFGDNYRFVSVFLTADGGYFGIQKNGECYFKGRNNYGEIGLGNNTILNITQFSSRDFRENSSLDYFPVFDKIVGGNKANYFIMKNGLYSAGYNDFGQLGIGNNENRNALTKINFSEPIKNIYSGFSDSLYVLTTNNDLYVCGKNDVGQLGLGDYENRNELTLIENFKVKNVYPTFDCVFIETIDGKIYATGNNKLNRLGLSEEIYNTFTLIPDIEYPDDIILNYDESYPVTIIKKGTLIYTSGSNRLLTSDTEFNEKFTVTDDFSEVLKGEVNNIDAEEIFFNSTGQYGIIDKQNGLWVSGENKNNMLDHNLGPNYIYNTFFRHPLFIGKKVLKAKFNTDSLLVYVEEKDLLGNYNNKIYGVGKNTYNLLTPGEAKDYNLTFTKTPKLIHENVTKVEFGENWLALSKTNLSSGEEEVFVMGDNRFGQLGINQSTLMVDPTTDDPATIEDAVQLALQPLRIYTYDDVSHQTTLLYGNITNYFATLYALFVELEDTTTGDIKYYVCGKNYLDEVPSVRIGNGTLGGGIFGQEASEPIIYWYWKEYVIPFHKDSSLNDEEIKDIRITKIVGNDDHHWALLNNNSVLVSGANDKRQLGISFDVVRITYPDFLLDLNSFEIRKNITDIAVTGKASFYLTTENELYAVGGSYRNYELPMRDFRGAFNNVTLIKKDTFKIFANKTLFSFFSYGEKLEKYDFDKYDGYLSGFFDNQVYLSGGLMSDDMSAMLGNNSPAIAKALPLGLDDYMKWRLSSFTNPTPIPNTFYNPEDPVLTEDFDNAFNFPSKVIKIETYDYNTEDRSVSPYNNPNNLLFYLLENGDLYVCGKCRSGEAGLGFRSGFVNKPTKVPLPLGVKVVDVFIKRFNGHFTSSINLNVFIKLDDGRYLFSGYNQYSGFGNGNYLFSSNAYAIGDRKFFQPSNIGYYGRNIVDIEFGWSHVVWITSDGEVFAKGYNTDNECGRLTNTTTHVNGFQQKVAIPKKVKRFVNKNSEDDVFPVVSHIYNHIVETVDGEYYVWGDTNPFNGYYGDNFVPTKLVIPTSFSFKDIKDIYFNHTGAQIITKTGDLWSVGPNTFGFNGTRGAHSTFVQVPLNKKVKRFFKTAQYANSIIVLDDEEETIMATGYNYAGLLTDTKINENIDIYTPIPLPPNYKYKDVKYYGQIQNVYNNGYTGSFIIMKDEKVFQRGTNVVLKDGVSINNTVSNRWVQIPVPKPMKKIVSCHSNTAIYFLAEDGELFWKGKSSTIIPARNIPIDNSINKTLNTDLQAVEVTSMGIKNVKDITQFMWYTDAENNACACIVKNTGEFYFLGQPGTSSVAYNPFPIKNDFYYCMEYFTDMTGYVLDLLKENGDDIKIFDSSYARNSYIVTKNGQLLACGETTDYRIPGTINTSTYYYWNLVESGVNSDLLNTKIRRLWVKVRGVYIEKEDDKLYFSGYSENYGSGVGVDAAINLQEVPLPTGVKVTDIKEFHSAMMAMSAFVTYDNKVYACGYRTNTSNQYSSIAHLFKTTTYAHIQSFTYCDNCEIPQTLLNDNPDLQITEIIVAFGFTFYFILSDGNVYQLGPDADAAHMSPTDSYTFSPGGKAWRWVFNLNNNGVFTKSDIKQLLFTNHQLFFLLNDGSLYFVGRKNGKLGLGAGDHSIIYKTLTKIAKCEPITIDESVILSNTDMIKDFDVGTWNSYILRKDGIGFVAGNNSYYQMGFAPNATSLPWTRLPFDNIKEIRLGRAFIVILLNDGTIRVAGNNTFGVLGRGNTSNMTQTEITANGNSSWCKPNGMSSHVITHIEVPRDGCHILALYRSPSLGKLGMYAWGSAHNYRCGYSNEANVTTPSNRGEIDNCDFIYAGYATIYKLTTEGALYAMGFNQNSECGVGNATTPITSWTLVTNTADNQAQNVKLLDDLKIGQLQVAAIRKDTYLTRFGYNLTGQLGTGNVSNITNFSASLININNVALNLKKILELNNHVTIVQNEDGRVFFAGCRDFANTREHLSKLLGLATQATSYFYTFKEIPWLKDVESVKYVVDCYSDVSTNISNSPDNNSNYLMMAKFKDRFVICGSNKFMRFGDPDIPYFSDTRTDIISNPYMLRNPNILSLSEKNLLKKDWDETEYHYNYNDIHVIRPLNTKKYSKKFFPILTLNRSNIDMELNFVNLDTGTVISSLVIPINLKDAFNVPLNRTRFVIKNRNLFIVSSLYASIYEGKPTVIASIDLDSIDFKNRFSLSHNIFFTPRPHNWIVPMPTNRKLYFGINSYEAERDVAPKAFYIKRVDYANSGNPTDQIWKLTDFSRLERLKTSIDDEKNIPYVQDDKDFIYGNDPLNRFPMIGNKEINNPLLRTKGTKIISSFIGQRHSIFEVSLDQLNYATGANLYGGSLHLDTSGNEKEPLHILTLDGKAATITGVENLSNVVDELFVRDFGNRQINIGGINKVIYPFLPMLFKAFARLDTTYSSYDLLLSLYYDYIVFSQKTRQGSYFSMYPLLVTSEIFEKLDRFLIQDFENGDSKNLYREQYSRIVSNEILHEEALERYKNGVLLLGDSRLLIDPDRTTQYDAVTQNYL